MLYRDYMESPLGTIEVLADEKGIKQVIFCGDELKEGRINDLTALCITQLKAYFKGQRQHFDLPFSVNGTVFQQRVWHALSEIPYGEVWSYGELANYLASPKAVRAVGSANGRNPLTIVVPCHRVVGANGKLTGYAGGVERKAWLLAHENPQSDFDKYSLNKQIIKQRQAKTEFLI